MPSYTTDNELVPQVQRITHIPTANVTFLAADICALADRETRPSLMNRILSVREGFYLTYIDIPVNTTGVFAIPYRAIAQRIHGVQMVVSTLIYPLARIEPKDMTNTINPPTNTYAFFIEGNNIVTLPILPSGVCRIWHYVRPSNLVSSTTCAQVTAINLGANTVTVSSVPTSFTIGTNIDFTQDQPPFSLLEYDVAIANIAGSVLTFGSGLVPSALAVGDWLCPAGTSPVPQMPLEFHPVLEQRTAVRCLLSQGYLQKAAAEQKKLEEMEKEVMSIINPRDEGNAKKIAPNRSLIRPGPNRSGRGWYVAP